MEKKISLLLCTVFFVLNSIAQDHPSWLRYPAISPDGSIILFNYKGDIYKVPASGETAVPLNLSENYYCRLQEDFHKKTHSIK